MQPPPRDRFVARVMHDGRCDVRILQTIGSVGEQAGGPSRTVVNLSMSVARVGYRVDLVAGYDARRDAALLTPDAQLVRFHRVTMRGALGAPLPLAFHRTVVALLTEARRVGAPVLIHDHGVWGATNVAAWLAATRAGVPYVLSPRGMFEPWALRFKPVRKKVAWLLYQRRMACSSATLVSTSSQERDNMRRLLPRLPIALIPNGVEWPAEIPDRSARPADRPARLLFMSRIHPKKNLPGLVQAWQEVCRSPSRNHWVLQIAGPDELDHAREVKALVRTLGLEARVQFLGPVDEGRKNVTFAGADLFVLPSFSENFGVVVAEAMAHGLPVVATHGTPWSRLVDLGCGWWIEPTPEAIARALGEAIDLSAAARQAMGLRARQYARDAFSWDEIGQATAHLYDWILGRTAAVPSSLSS